MTKKNEAIGGADDSAAIPPVSGERGSGKYCCKVERVTRAYGLAGMDAELQRRHQEADATLHELATYLNTRLTAKTLEATEIDVSATPWTVRAALVGDDSVPASRRGRLREALVGRVDIDRLAGDFVSHETVRRHLKDHLDVSTSRGGFESASDLESALETYQRQYVDGVEGALERAARQSIIAGESFSVYRTRIECSACGTTYRLEDLLAAGGCDCNLDAA